MPSATTKPPLSAIEMQRYQRHLSLPDFDITAQMRLKNAHILMVGAGGLGAAALPYLAGAGAAHITIYDDDAVSLSNLHRQTIFKNTDQHQNKAQLAANYARAINPDITVTAVTTRIGADSVPKARFDLIFDGSDNFKTKTWLNELSIQTETPLLSASVNQYAGQCGIFAGYSADRPCYHCLFPALPADARNCNEAGVLGTAAGITGLYQAHLALMYLAGFNEAEPGQFINFDFKTHRMQNLYVTKNKDCAVCTHAGKNWIDYKTKDDTAMITIISMQELQPQNHQIVDVRTGEEIKQDPIAGALHIEVSEIPARHGELPRDKVLAFVCAGNVRSVQAAEYLQAMGYDNIVVLDKFSL